MNAIHSHRQPVAHAADVARGTAPPRMGRDERTGGGALPVASAGSILVTVSASFAVASMVFLSGPLPIPPDLVTDDQRIALGLVCGGVSLAFAGLSALFRTLDANLPPRGVAVLKARARFQRISRNQIRRKRQRFMRAEFQELVRQLSSPRDTKVSAALDGVLFPVVVA